MDYNGREPNNAGGVENCLLLVHAKNDDWKWNDVNEQSINAFICENETI